MPLSLTELDEAPQLSLWQRLDVAYELLADGAFDRQAKCQRTRRIPRDEDVVIKRHESGGYTLHGLVRCGLWTCPHCGPQRARSTSAALAVAFARHRQADVFHDLWMLTLASPHYADEDPVGVVARLYDASAIFLLSIAWRRFAARWGIVGRVRVLDATHGGPNGSHPHFHIALFPTLASLPTWFAGEEDLDELLPVQPLAGASAKVRARWLAELRGGLME